MKMELKMIDSLKHWLLMMKNEAENSKEYGKLFLVEVNVICIKTATKNLALN